MTWLALRTLLGRVPIWVWVIAAVLAWGGWQRHAAKTAERKASEIREAIVKRDAEEARDAADQRTLQLEAQRAATDKASQNAAADRAAANRARAAEQRLHERIAQDQTNAAASASTDGGKAAGETAAVLADVLRRCIGRVRELADYADASRTAGEACEASYDALTTAPRE